MGLLLSNVLAQSRVQHQLQSVLAAAHAEQRLAGMMKFVTLGSAAVAVLAPLVMAVGITYITYFMCVFLGIRAPFSRLFSVIMWCLIPVLAVGSLVKATAMLLTPVNLTIQLSMSPIVLFPQALVSAHPWLQIYLSSLDVFVVWGLVQFWVTFCSVQKLRVTNMAWLPIVLHTAYAGVLILVGTAGI